MLIDALIGIARQRGHPLRARADILSGAANTRHHACQRLAHAVEAARQLTDLIAAGLRHARTKITGTERLRLLYQIAQRAQFAAQQPDHGDHRQQQGQCATDSQLGTDTPGNGLNFLARHARQHHPGSASKGHGDAVEFILAIVPETAVPRVSDQLAEGCRQCIQSASASGLDQPLAVLVEQGK